MILKTVAYLTAAVIVFIPMALVEWHFAQSVIYSEAVIIGALFIKMLEAVVRLVRE